mmetsp:Transcript_49787/g.73145  ORF Transcript_49787/g.73145 Transcript_49787/m.73145 type:complete len:123 (+) Transcript_49787:430-798(+)
MASHRGPLPSLAASRPVFGSSPFRIQGNCSRRVRSNIVLLARSGAPSCRMCQYEQVDDGGRLCSTATGAPAPWHTTAGPFRGLQRGARSFHPRHGWFCSSATARRCICLRQCEQADDGSRLC